MPRKKTEEDRFCDSPTADCTHLTTEEGRPYCCKLGVWPVLGGSTKRPLVCAFCNGRE